MRSVVDHVRELTRATPRRWLVVGKGPTADYICRVDTTRYHVLTLNHACRVVRPAVAHFVDAEAVEDCLPHLRQGLFAVAAPWHPHRHHKAHADTLAQYPWAGEFGDLLLSYNATTANTLPRNPALPVIRLRYFSAVAAFNILVAAGVRSVHSIGVDGGTGYAEAFDKRTRLANGRSSFDVQFGEINQTLKKNKVHWHRLDETTDDPEDRAPNPPAPPPHG